MNQQKEEEVVVFAGPSSTSKIAVVIMFIWALLGILAFITSLVCFAYDGSFMQNWVGFLTAIIMGPFYWIFYAYSDGYCASGSSRRQQVQKQILTKVKQVKRKLGKKKL